MSDETLTWPSVCDEIRRGLEIDLDHGNIDLDGDLDEIAWELADADANAWTYWRANSLWLDSSDVRDFEEEADELGWDEGETIQDRICRVVFLALRSEYRDALDDLREARLRLQADLEEASA
jgi:hypothetical protein